MAESSDAPCANELQACFNDLKKHSVSYKLGRDHQTVGDEAHNPLHKQFSLILAKLDDILAKQNKESEEYIKIVSMKASIIYEKAKILLTENLLNESKSLLEDALDLTKDYSEHPKVAFLHMRIVNHLTYVLSRLGSLEDAKELLIKAIENEEKCNPEVFSTDDLFLNTKKDPKMSASKITKLTINNMQMLAWIYARLGNTKENLKMQHDVLQKQLDTAEGDVLRWAESCFRLGGMFVGQGDWTNAVYHLTAAESVLNPLEVALVPNPEVYAAQADLARTWVYYGLHLFENSRKATTPQDIEPDPQEDLHGKENDEPVLEEPKESISDRLLLTFRGLNVELNPKVPTTPISKSEEAKQLFAYMQRWIKRARLFYTLRDYPLQYVNLCLDLSELYRFLAFYEEDLESQYAVQKRRYDALETLSSILKEVRPNCYVAVNVELTKELVEVQMELMNLNLKKLYSPPEEPKTDVNEEALRKQMDAFGSIHRNLENVTSALNNSDLDVLKGITITEIHSEKEPEKMADTHPACTISEQQDAPSTPLEESMDAE